ncbi:hypothetical protein Pelo_13228 [Pelomyxa schiedti]|nr:hypothetical protein Pelo_13228 [Pelomyxa schiedti]
MKCHKVTTIMVPICEAGATAVILNVQPPLLPETLAHFPPSKVSFGPTEAHCKFVYFVDSLIDQLEKTYPVPEPESQLTHCISCNESATILCLCELHDNEKRKLFCLTDLHPICTMCAVLNHKDHKIVSLQEYSRGQFESISLKVEAVRSQTSTLNTAISVINDSLTEIQKDHSKFETEVHCIVEEMTAQLRNLESSMVEKSYTTHASQISQLLEQLGMFTFVRDSILHHLQKISSVEDSAFEARSQLPAIDAVLQPIATIPSGLLQPSFSFATTFDLQQARQVLQMIPTMITISSIPVVVDSISDATTSGGIVHLRGTWPPSVKQCEISVEIPGIHCTNIGVIQPGSHISFCVSEGIGTGYDVFMRVGQVRSQSKVKFSYQEPVIRTCLVFLASDCLNMKIAGTGFGTKASDVDVTMITCSAPHLTQESGPIVVSVAKRQSVPVVIHFSTVICTIKMWGGGGAGGYSVEQGTNGGAGGFCMAKWSCANGDELFVTVGKGGTCVPHPPPPGKSSTCAGGAPNGGNGGKNYGAGGGGGSSHVTIKKCSKCPEYKGLVLLGAGGGGGAPSGKYGGTGGGGGGGTHNGKVGRGGNGGEWAGNSDLSPGENGGGGGGSAGVVGSASYTGASGEGGGGKGGDQDCSGECSNGAGGSTNPGGTQLGGGGGGGAASHLEDITTEFRVVNARDWHCPNPEDPDSNRGTVGEGGRAGGQPGHVGRVVITTSSGRTVVFDEDGRFVVS